MTAINDLLTESYKFELFCAIRQNLLIKIQLIVILYIINKIRNTFECEAQINQIIHILLPISINNDYEGDQQPDNILEKQQQEYQARRKLAITGSLLHLTRKLLQLTLVLEQAGQQGILTQFDKQEISKII